VCYAYNNIIQRTTSLASQPAREVEPTARTETLKKLTTRRAYGSTHYSSWPDAACTRTHTDGGLARLEGPSRAPCAKTATRPRPHTLTRTPYTHAHGRANPHYDTHTHTHTRGSARARTPTLGARARSLVDRAHAHPAATHFVHLRGPRSRTRTQRLVETGSSVIHQSVRPKRHRPITVPNTCKHLHLRGAATQYFMTHNYILLSSSSSSSSFGAVSTV